VENRLPSFLASACLHLAAAALLFLAPRNDIRPVPAGGIAVSGYVTLGKPGAAPREAKNETASAGDGSAVPEKTPPPPSEPSASSAPPAPAAQQTPPAPPETQTPAGPPTDRQEASATREPRTPPPPAEVPKNTPEASPRDPSAVPIPKNPEKTEVKTPEPPNPPPKPEPPKKTEPPKKNEPPKKVEPPKKGEPPKKPPAASKPPQDDLAGALAELGREVSGKNPKRGGSGPVGRGRSGDGALSGALADLGKEAGGRGNGPSGSGPGGDGGDGYGVLGAYQDSIISRVRPNWSLPARADRRSYTAVVNIKIDRDGVILEARIIRSSGNGFFDASVMQAVAATKTLEPPPHPDYADINISFTPETLSRQ
jgi:TonB family protein